MVLRAPAKLNLCLYLGGTRSDGLHEICSLFQPLSLSDRIEVEPAGGDEVVCAGIEQGNLAERALQELRLRGWSHPPVRVTIEKRIPVAAGLGGGSADAAAVLRLAAEEVSGLDEAAASLGADVPSQLDPALTLVRGAGEKLERLPAPGNYAVVLVPSDRGLATAAVYEEADRMGVARGPAELDDAAGSIRAVATAGASPLDYLDLLVNDLQPAALSLAPEIELALGALRDVGAARAMVTGSGPTAFGIFHDVAAADRAIASLPPRFAGAMIATPDRQT